MTEGPSQPPAPPTEPPPILASPGDPQPGLICLVCGYSLFSLAPEALCPECGTPVERSRKGSFLRFSNPQFVRTLWIGIVVAELATVAYLVAKLFEPAWALIIQTTGLFGPAPNADEVVTIMTAAASVAALGGWFLFTSPDPVLAARDPSRKVRKLARICVIVQFVGAVAELVSWAARSSGGVTAPWAKILLSGASGAGQIMWIIQFFAGMRLIELLAMRAEAPLVAARARSWRIWIPVLAIVASCVVIGPIIAGCMYVMLMDDARRAIGRARRLSELPGGV